MAQFLGWDESNFLRLQSMLGGAGTSMHNGQKCIDFVPKFNFYAQFTHAALFYHCDRASFPFFRTNSIAKFTFDVAS